MADQACSRYRNRLVVLAKQPAAGRVKTRLARQIGTSAAVGAYRKMLHSLLREVAHDARWQTRLAIDPPSALNAGLWPEGPVRTAQVRGDLGQRMQWEFDSCPPGPVVIIGCDIPAVRRAHIAQAFLALGSHDAVIGPAADGGYWLIGAKRLPHAPRMFGGVRWSSAHARADTLANLKGLKVAMLDELEDVDNAAAWRRWRSAL